MKKAVLIGINEYKRSPLKGCVNDVKDVEKICNSKGYETILLIDEAATKKNIMASLNNVSSKLKDGDSLLVWFSGHGVQMPSINDQNEIDGLDEGICPIDFAWTNETVIRDNELGLLFAKISVDVNIVFVSDSCHSGDLQRAMVTNLESNAKRMLPENQPFHASILENRLKVKSITNAVKQSNLLYISACKSDQTAADSVFENKPNGALTYYLLKSLSVYPIGSTASTIVNDVKRRLKIAGFSQVPTISAITSRLRKSIL